MSETKSLKILNLYAGVGGNRKYWGNDHEITAVEYDPKIAAIYKSFFPNDIVIIGDAHQYLIDHYKEFDFIWASPPCPSHSQVNHFLNAQGVIRYPDMSLYQEIIFLQYFHKGMYCVENVKSYYEPLVKPQVSGRHYFWANFKIPEIKKKSDVGKFGPVKGGRTEGQRDESLGFDIKNYNDKNKKIVRTGENSGFSMAELRNNFDNLQMIIPIKQWTNVGKSYSRKVLNNCCHPEIGLAILESALGIIKENTVQPGQLF